MFDGKEKQKMEYKSGEFKTYHVFNHAITFNLQFRTEKKNIHAVEKQIVARKVSTKSYFKKQAYSFHFR